MKTCIIMLNPTPAQLVEAGAVCAEMNRSRQERNLYGTVHVLTFCSAGASVLAIAWKQSFLVDFSQSVLDVEANPDILIQLIERALSRNLIFDDSRRLREGEVESIRAKTDPDPTEDLLARFPEAAKLDVKFGATRPGTDAAAAWCKVQTLLTVAESAGVQAAPSWLNEVPSFASAGVLSLASFLPETAFMMDGTGESYLLMRPREEIIRAVFPEDAYGHRGCYRLFRLNGLVVSEVPVLWVHFCQCGHVMSFESADGTFEFEFHKDKQSPHGFILGETPRRFSLVLSAVTGV